MELSASATFAYEPDDEFFVGQVSRGGLRVRGSGLFADRDIDIGDIAAAAGVSRRSMQLTPRRVAWGDDDRGRAGDRG